VFPLESLAVEPWAEHGSPTVAAAAVAVGEGGADVVATVVTEVDGRVVAPPPEPLGVRPELQAPNTASATPTPTRGRSLSIVATPWCDYPRAQR
jgi:hypothetical protein